MRGSSAVGWRLRARSMRATSGTPKAMVLPEPVGARPHTSRPSSASGMVAAWMSKGCVIPLFASDGDEVGGDAEILERTSFIKGRD